METLEALEIKAIVIASCNAGVCEWFYASDMFARLACDRHPNLTERGAKLIWSQLVGK